MTARPDPVLSHLALVSDKELESFNALQELSELKIAKRSSIQLYTWYATLGQTIRNERNARRWPDRFQRKESISDLIAITTMLQGEDLLDALALIQRYQRVFPAGHLHHVVVNLGVMVSTYAFGGLKGAQA